MNYAQPVRLIGVSVRDGQQALATKISRKMYYLSEHPEVQMSLAKEIHFFSRHYDRGVDWYEKQFRSGGNPRIMGEFSTTYMLDPEVASDQLCLKAISVSRAWDSQMQIDTGSRRIVAA
jgi:hypothetical protein